MTIPILYLDESIVVCHKPINTLCEGDTNTSLPYLLAEELRARGEQKTEIFVVHRLDRTTQGVMVFARTSVAAASLSRAISDRSTVKEYLAIVCGKPECERGTLTDLLFYDRARGKSFVVQRERKGVKTATLDYELIEHRAPHSFLRIRLHTGRTHQIRVQFASRGMPLCGDRPYGAPPSDSPILLCAHKLSFAHPKTNELMHFSCLPTATNWTEFSFFNRENRL
jgi:23S rRNA pseudouridine1911/1915/1917 synthase